MKIGITGSNNTGKSTLASTLHASLKERGIRAVIVEESVRESPLGSKERTTVEATAWIMLRQIQREIVAEHYDDFVIGDRTTIDSYAYALWSFKELEGESIKKRSLLDWLAKVARDWAKTYSCILYLPVLPNLRVNTWHEGIDHRNQVDQNILETLAAWRLPYISVPVVPTVERVDFIMKQIDELDGFKAFRSQQVSEGND